MDVHPSSAIKDPIADAVQNYSTGLDDLDRCVGGLRPGELWAITAAPGQGRSALLTQLAVRMAVNHRVSTWLISNRDTGQVVSARAHSIAGLVPLDHLTEDRLTEHTKPRLAHARSVLASAPLGVVAERYASQMMFGDHRLRLKEANTAVFFDDPGWPSGWRLEEARALADDGAMVVVTMPRSEVLPSQAFSCDLTPEMSLTDLVLEVRLHDLKRAGGPARDEPGLATIAVLRNRRGPTYAISVICQTHYSRFLSCSPTPEGQQRAST